MVLSGFDHKPRNPHSAKPKYTSREIALMLGVSTKSLAHRLTHPGAPPPEFRTKPDLGKLYYDADKVKDWWASLPK